MNEDILVNSSIQVKDVAGILSTGMYNRLFSNQLEIIPQLNEVYELALSFYESQILTEEEIIRNAAYFARANGTFTRHFLMCIGEPLLLPKHSSSRLRSFFVNNQFKTGYATHGLFPYRGKFHPQMIKGLINIMGLRQGDTIVDPMMGSGTVLIEARLMGINAIGFDASPFCRFMTQTKLDALLIPQKPLHTALKNHKALFEYFVGLVGQPEQGSKIKKNSLSNQNDLVREPSKPYCTIISKQYTDVIGSDNPEVYNFLLLAYLDSAGYSERSKGKSPLEQFRMILERYIFVVEKIQRILKGTESELSKTEAFTGDARSLPLEDYSVDGILFSPPYSFAVNYIENDSFHLNFMGEDLIELQRKMIGLRGQKLNEKYELYIEDMDNVLLECARILRPTRFCTIVVGTNNNQLSKVLGVSPEKVPGLHQILIEHATKHSLVPIRILSRRINGIANTMRDEYIVILQRK